MIRQVKFSPYEGGHFVAEHNTVPARVLEDTERLRLDDSNSVSVGTRWQDNNIPISVGPG